MSMQHNHGGNSWLILDNETDEAVAEFGDRETAEEECRRGQRVCRLEGGEVLELDELGDDE